MGLLLGRYDYVELPRELHDAAVGETVVAAASARQWILYCPRCHRRLCPLVRASASGGGPSWQVPSSRVEKPWLGGGTTLRCRFCGSGRLPVEEFAQPGHSSSIKAATPRSIAAIAQGEEDISAQRRVALRLPSTAAERAFRPFSACVCGNYETVVDRVAALLNADVVASSRQVHVTRRTLRRSDLATGNGAADALPALPMELLVVAHRISGARNPITDAHGLYTSLIDGAWDKADVVLVCLLDVPRDSYFQRMLTEQPTLLGLLATGRLLPIFLTGSEGGAAQPDSGEGPFESTKRSRGAEVAEAACWLVRCLDGRVPRVGAMADLTQAVGCPGGASAREAASSAAATGARDGNTLSIMAAVAQEFDSQRHVLVRE